MLFIKKNCFKLSNNVRFFVKNKLVTIMERNDKIFNKVAFIAAQLKKWRREKGITQPIIADFLNIQQPNYHRLEKGKSYLDITLAFRICQYYNKSGVELHYLHAQGDCTPEIALLNSVLTSSINHSIKGEISNLKKNKTC